MATSSIFHNIVIDSPEKAEKLVEALEKSYTQEICNIKRSCWNCAYFDEDTYPLFIDEGIGEAEYNVIYTCEKETQVSKSSSFPYKKEMECFASWNDYYKDEDLK